MPRRRALSLAQFLLAAMVTLLIVVAMGAKFERQDVGHVGVIRNGGPLDARGIREFLNPAQRLTWTGWFSQKPHEYPASHVELLYNVISDAKAPAQPGTDVVSVPTRDGVQVGLKATVYYHFVGERDAGVLSEFDSGFGTRKYPVGDRNLHPWESDDAFSGFMDTVFRPILDNDLRRELGRYRCEQLVASCALVQRSTGPTGVGNRFAASTESHRNIARIEKSINSALQKDLERTLEAPYFWGVHFRISAVTLPGKVQVAVDDVMANYASVSGSRADVEKARYEDERNRILARTLERSPALARIHEIKAAPTGTTLILSTGGKSGDTPGINVGK